MAVKVVSAQAIEHEFEHLPRGCCRVDPLGIQRSRGSDELLQVQIQFAFDQRTQYAERCPAQSIGVFFAGRLLSDCKYANYRVQLVTDREYLAGRCCRSAVACASRHVLFIERGRHFRVFAAGLGIALAHDALQGRELADHVGHEIAFAQRGRTARMFDICTQQPGDPFREFGEPPGLVPDRAEL